MATMQARGWFAALVTITALMAVLALVVTGRPPDAPPQANDPSRTSAGPAVAAPGGVDPGRPSVVLVLVDDMSMDLLRTMRSAKTMRERGASYPHSFVVDSLCCPSRASTFTGQYPHQTGVRLNMSARSASGEALGGWPAFVEHGNQERTVAVRLQDAGYTTGYVGKYLNEYDYLPGKPLPAPIPGWDELDTVSVSANDGWDFGRLALEGGRIVAHHHPAPPASASPAVKDEAYVGSYIEDASLRFIREQEARGAPYFLQVAPLAPHSRTKKQGAYPGDPNFAPAFRDRPSAAHPDGNCGRLSCRQITLRDLPGYGDERDDNAPFRIDGRRADAWQPVVPSLTPSEAVEQVRDRARMLQSVDRMLGRVLDAVGPDTYVIFTSDNGYHVGQLGMGVGKGTAYTSDIRVPLLVVGPGVRPGARREIVNNLDLAPTLEGIAGLEPAPYRSGRSLLPSLAEPRLRQRNYVFVEHTWGKKLTGDPDGGVGGRGIGAIPSYVAVRGRQRLLVRYDLDRTEGHRYVYEFYDLSHERFERRNVFGRSRRWSSVRKMLAQLAWFDACSAAVGDDPVLPGCRNLGRPPKSG